MKAPLSATFLILGTLLSPFIAYAEGDAGSSTSVTYVKDSVITTKIKSKLAAEHLTSLTNINVDTDKAGAVWLSGTAASQADAEKALAIANKTEGVTSVKSNITIKPPR